ncbi:MAG: hypothetical protein EPO46_02370 [Lysobacter sp.]|nr:MAG: hypothetical protein EPO46_02370 [Lysobacter sp.]
MKLTTLASTLALGLVLSVPATRDAEAAFIGIQRCQSPDGTMVYTDKPCALLAARPVAIPAELNLRLASESSRGDAISTLEGDAVSAELAMSSAQRTARVGRRSAAAGCARTPTQLAMDLEGSLALRDVNRLAESFHWVGMTQKQAVPVMKELERMSRRTVSNAQFYDAGIGMGLDYADASGGAAVRGAGIMQVNFQTETGMLPVQLNVEQYAGCYFVRF